MQQQSVLGANNTLPLCTPAAMIWPAISGNTAVEVCSRLCSSAAVSLSLWPASSNLALVPRQVADLHGKVFSLQNFAVHCTQNCNGKVSPHQHCKAS